jgi:hypothetical protein
MGIRMLEKKEETDMYLKFKLGEKEEEIQQNFFIRIASPKIIPAGPGTLFLKKRFLLGYSYIEDSCNEVLLYISTVS